MKNLVFALTEISGSLLLLIGTVYLATLGWILLAGWRGSEATQMPLRKLLAAPFLTFLAFWCAGQGLAELCWWLWFGDTRAPSERVIAWLTGGIALFAALLLLTRMALGRASERYVAYPGGAATVMFALVGVIYAYEFLRRIDGWDARAVAERHFEQPRFVLDPFREPGAPRHIVEEPPQQVAYSSRPVRTFVLCYGERKVVRLSVAPYGWWWWTVSSQTPLHVGDNVAERFDAFRRDINLRRMEAQDPHPAR